MRRNMDYSSTHVNAVIDEYINYANCGKNAMRNREIIRERLINGVCFEPLAEHFDISVRQCKNIVYKMQEIVFKHL